MHHLVNTLQEVDTHNVVYRTSWSSFLFSSSTLLSSMCSWVNRNLKRLDTLCCLQELFGPLSMRALEEDRYVRQTEGYLPKANVAFIDEIFKANSAILNTLLTVLNERLFDNGSSREAVPLLCMVRHCLVLSWRRSMHCLEHSDDDIE